MGNYKFRLSNIIPNSWFYTSITSHKLKHNLTKTQPITTSSSSSSSFPSIHPDQRKSYYFTRDLIVPDPNKPDYQPDLRKKSSKKKRPITPKTPIRHKFVSPETGPTVLDEWSSTENISPDRSLMCKTKFLNDDVFKKADLPRIITKQVKHDNIRSGKRVYDPVRKVKGSSYSPRLGNRVRVNGLNCVRRRNVGRRSLSESMAVVKVSVDPQRDFKESMVEMIVENDIKSSKDLEDLLACYLSLNSNEYHGLIIKVFKEIWFECTVDR
ncbi:hypothetical protein QVD17_16850 [Tagetes erecta]|uniref:Transcription repressor n=1 Tax=Tagetes erecta TaxID=13708 RepID=A0AAD8NTU2_TARER|nr:hypothetical protein QVD17_16850 [Tagetes erecta]